jgi:hypothetical protein
MAGDGVAAQNGVTAVALEHFGGSIVHFDHGAFFIGYSDRAWKALYQSCLSMINSVIQ